MILKYQMEPGNHIMVIMTGGSLLLFYGAARSIYEAICMWRESVYGAGELFLIIFIGTPPLFIGGFLGIGPIAVTALKL